MYDRHVKGVILSEHRYIYCATVVVADSDCSCHLYSYLAPLHARTWLALKFYTLCIYIYAYIYLVCGW